MSGPISTVGHSTRPIGELLALLGEAAVPVLIDVRRYPGSRRHPQFGGAALQAALQEAGIHYRHEPDLGGRREPRAGSPNTAWRNEAFRGYADHMASPEFAAALQRLMAAPAGSAVMCAEALPWRCHRQLIADALVLHGVQVRHLIAPGRSELHVPHPSARLLDGVVVYPGRATGRGQRTLFDGGGRSR